MNKVVASTLKALAGVAGAALIAGSASAADLAAPEPAIIAEVPPLVDVAFGVAGVTDYRFRGIAQSNKNPAVQGYAELQVADWFYAGVWGSSVDFPTARGLANPAMEIDFYGGIRHSWDAFSIDVGGLYYYYPGQKNNLRDMDYWELYAKPGFSFGDIASITGNLYWTTDFANLGNDALYLSVIPKVNVPLNLGSDIAVYVSGEFGKQWFKSSRLANPKDYVTWNVGAGLTYKAMTLDVRYSDTNLNKNECVINTGARSWCGSAVVGKIAFDTTLNSLK